LKKADDYEVEDYERVSACMASGHEVWIYRAGLKIE
jgi:hypothetical protein